MGVLLVVFSFVQVSLADLTQGSAKQIKNNKLYNCLKKDSFTFSTAYFDGYYTNEQLVNINLEFLRASNRVYSVLKDTKWFVRWPAWYFLAIVNTRASTALHEAGHALRVNAFGLDYVFTLNQEGRGVGEKNIIVYYLKQMTFQGAGGACLFNFAKYKDKILNKEHLGDIIIGIGAGGLNNEMLLSERISIDMHARKQWDSLSWFIHLDQKMFGVFYDLTAKADDLSHDPSVIIKAFNQKGRTDFERGTISKAGIISTLLSATTYSIFTRKPTVFRRFRLPDFYPYITTRGMSYKAVSGYEFNEDTVLLFALESVFEKNCVAECSIGIDSIAKWQLPIHYKITTTLGLGFNLEALIKVPLSSSFLAGIGCEYYHYSSLKGQRDILRNILNVAKESISINENSTSTNVYFFISYMY